MELTKREIRDIQAYDDSFNPDNIQGEEEARGEEINDIIVVSLGRRGMHDSGYPFLRMIGRQYKQGVAPKIKYFDLGWHDHYICYIPVNVDSYGKNIFRLMPWMNKEKDWQVSPHFISCSTFQIGCAYPEIGPENTLS